MTFLEHFKNDSQNMVFFKNNSRTNTIQEQIKEFKEFNEWPHCQHKQDLVYYSKCPEPTRNENYLGETGRRIIQRSAGHCGRDKQSHLLRHALNNNHKTVVLKNVKIIDSSYHNNRFKRKISEALYIKQYTPSLNTQQQSVELKPFN